MNGYGDELNCSSITFSRHALEQMFVRGLTVEDVTEVVRSGELIEDYSDDKPYPSCLLMAQIRGREVHVVAARDPATSGCIVVTAYEPNLHVWEPDFRTRRKK